MNINLCPLDELLLDQMDINLCPPNQLSLNLIDINLCLPEKLLPDLLIAQMDKNARSSKTLTRPNGQKFISSC